MKKCVYCGKESPDEASVCPWDGNPLTPSSPGGPPAVPAHAARRGKQSSGLAITSLVLGVLSIVACGVGVIFTLPAVICGHIAFNRAKRDPARYGGAGLAIAGFTTGYASIFFVAISAGLLLPALAKAKEKAVRINCVNNLKQVGLAIRISAGDKGNVLPRSLVDLSNELGSPNILLCPADPRHTSNPNGYKIWDPANVSYQYLTPGANADKVVNQVIVRCPFHNNELMGDGSVFQRPLHPSGRTPGN